MQEHRIRGVDEENQQTLLAFAGRPAALNRRRMFMRFLEQVEQDQSARQVALRHLVVARDYPTLYWQIKALGQQKRMDAIRILNQRYGHATVSDPSKDAPYSQFSLFKAALQSVNINWTTTIYPVYRQTLPLEVQRRERPIGDAPTPYAWLQLYPKAIPVMMMDPRPDVPKEVVLFQAASVLGLFLKNLSDYSQVCQETAVFLPEWWDDKLIIPLVHSFARGLFQLEVCPATRYVPLGRHCLCAAIVAELNSVPKAHPEATGDLAAAYMPGFYAPQHTYPADPQPTSQIEAQLREQYVASNSAPLSPSQLDQLDSGDLPARHSEEHPQSSRPSFPTLSSAFPESEGGSHNPPNVHPLRRRTGDTPLPDRIKGPLDPEDIDTMRLDYDVPDVPDESEQRGPRERTSGS